jgi:hypothetical protein
LSKHAKKHLREDFLTIPAAKRLRKLAGKSVLVTETKTGSRSRTPEAGPSGYQHVFNEQGNQHPHFVQKVKAVNGNAGVVISMDPSGTEKTFHAWIVYKQKRTIRLEFKKTA